MDEELARLSAQGLLRGRRGAVAASGPSVELGGRRCLNLCSNDYLGLGGRRVQGLSGAGASRLVVGDLDVHRELERALAEWLRVEDVLLFASGYAANVGAVAALGGPDALIVSDALNHASIVDGCRLSRARVAVVPHGDVAAVESVLRSASERRRLVVTDGYFSMDGTLAPLSGLADVCRRFGAGLYVDDAHSLGVWGPEGRGAAAMAGVTPDVLVGTLGKSFGGAGAFVAGSSSLVKWLWNSARSFVFSTGLAPVAAAAALEALPEVRGGARTARLHENASIVRSVLSAEGSRGPIIPVVLGNPERAVAASARLLEQGVFVQAIRPPTVPRGTSRLRVTVQSEHDPRELARAAELIAEEAAR